MLPSTWVRFVVLGLGVLGLLLFASPKSKRPLTTFYRLTSLGLPLRVFPVGFEEDLPAALPGTST